MLFRSLFQRLVDSLYVEAMIMADEARAYFDAQGDADRESLSLTGKVAFACESLKVTTRLMHVIAWLLTQRGWFRGEISREALDDPKYHLGEAAASDSELLAAFPFLARELMMGSQELYERVARLQGRMGIGPDVPTDEDEYSGGPARLLMDRLERAF